MQTIRIATRQSQLALWQAHFIRDELLRVHADINVELVGMTTKGDRWLQAPLSEVGGKGLFVKELEAAMLADDADIAVHSAKDIPAQLPSEFALPVLAYRNTVNDVLVSPHGDLNQLPQGARVGSSSLRRQAQLLAVRGDLQVLPIRGNVDTRLGKLDAGEFDAIVLAAAGLNRLGLERDDVTTLSTQLCLPAPGQAALGIECLADAPVLDWLRPLMDESVARCVQAERGVSQALGADCSLPIAALARTDDAKIGSEIQLEARIASVDGGQILRARSQGIDPQAVAGQAVDQLLAQGGEALLAELHGSGQGHT